MRKGGIVVFAGIALGAVAVVGAALLLQKFRKNKYVAEAEDQLVERVLAIARKSRIAPAKSVAKKIKPKKSVKSKKADAHAVAKKGKEQLLAKKMKKGVSYSQIELAEMSGIPYRSVRRYVEELVAQGKVSASGYGKGKTFSTIA
jgi:hypothetical protein